MELASDLRTMTEVAAILSEVTGRTVTTPVLTPEEAVERGLPPFAVNAAEQINENGSPACPEIAQALGLPTTDLRTWARRTFSRPALVEVRHLDDAHGDQRGPPPGLPDRPAGTEVGRSAHQPTG
ncbi:hypothetical protein O7543_15255 [Solwaraspora sp. WMMA2080]|uniref:hypothetical protein n=1 Tax=unclassified Solwaraspora TaxID=2627926 RepID=UPI00248B2A50|nr:MULTISPECIES: hypothetical protein [unclassified Solwaraspora]WBC00546.1 hypothetical protein O7553_02090 [Solwaraspora sp. WMMA2059]WBC24054.1 hypothetical protein O7543_15255 [Solwaraspora sp. WMMA2080]